MKSLTKRFTKRILPGSTRTWLWFQLQYRQFFPMVGHVRFGSLRRLKPISRLFGFDRGQPIDRYYIETFLQKNRSDIGGRVLEIGDPGYTLKFGGDQLLALMCSTSYPVIPKQLSRRSGNRSGFTR